MQVVQLLESGIVRCVPLSPIDGLAAGMTVLSAGRRIEAPAGREALDRAVRLLAGPVREPDRPPELLETGIKVIDVMCPLVFLIFAFIPPHDAPERAFQEVWAKEGQEEWTAEPLRARCFSSSASAVAACRTRAAISTCSGSTRPVSRRRDREASGSIVG